jgi:hypothetical protein
MMALPAFRHGHGVLHGHGALHGHGTSAGHGGPAAVHGHGVHQHAVAPHDAGNRGASDQLVPADPARETALRFLPSPRSIFSALAVYGAFGNAAVHAFHLSFTVAAWASAVPALLVEWLLIKPVWNVLFRFQGSASSPLGDLVLTEARAVVSFKNGRGVVSTIRDGRQVQLVAQLRSDQTALRVNVGDRLLIEHVDAARERVTVSIQ